jgi:SHS2 domain-containing protein
MKTIIEETLNKVLKSGGYENYFIISIDEDYYLQGACANGDNFIDLEITGEKYLPETKKYRSEIKAIIRELAWQYPNSENDNYFQILASVSDDEIAQVATTIFETLTRVFRIQNLESSQIEINLLDE